MCWEYWGLGRGAIGQDCNIRRDGNIGRSLHELS